MASKEATVYIVDVGSTMGEQSNGREQTNLDWALTYVYDKITSTVATGRKTAMAGVVALRTDETSNDLQKDPAYENITVLQPIGQIQMPHVRRLREALKVNDTASGDAISALIVAIQMIRTHCKKLQYVRKIVLVTDARATMDSDDLSEIKSKITEDNMELVVLGVDFDDAEYGFKEEAKDPTKAENEEVLRVLCDDCNGVFGTLAQAVEELQIPRVKTTKPIPSYRGFLTLGNPEDYETALAIDVERYPKVMVAKPPSATKFAIRTDMASGEATQSTATLADGEDAPNGTHGGLDTIINARTYQVDDETAPGGKLDLELKDLSKGYEYGRTAVHISESDRNVTDYETKPGLEILGFVEKKRYEHYMDMSRTNMIIASRTNNKASMSLSSIIHALFELESYAVARLVVKENKAPLLLLLAPNIEPDFECLYDVELPFAEDIRSYKFPPLDRVVTVGGKTLKIHRNLPSDELSQAMSDYVDSMDLSTFGKDDEGEDAEYMPPDETFSPMLHRIHQVIKHRAIYPENPPPPPYEILTRFSQPPEKLVQKAKSALDRVIEAGEVKKVPPKARGKRFGRRGEEAEKPLSGLNVDELLENQVRRKAKSLDRNEPEGSFKRLLRQTADHAENADAFRQLGGIIRDLIKTSYGSAKFDRALRLIILMREEANGLDDASLYNDFLRDLKAKLVKEELGGNRTEMWTLIGTAKPSLVLLSTEEAPNGVDMDKEQTRAFWAFQL